MGMIGGGGGANLGSVVGAGSGAGTVFITLGVSAGGGGNGLASILGVRVIICTVLVILSVGLESNESLSYFDLVGTLVLLLNTSLV